MTFFNFLLCETLESVGLSETVLYSPLIISRYQIGLVATYNTIHL